MTAVRIKTRDIYNINGNTFEDFFSSLFFYPNVATQFYFTTEDIEGRVEEKNKKDMKENGELKTNDTTISKEDISPDDAVFI